MAMATATAVRWTARVPRRETRQSRRKDKKRASVAHRRPFDSRPPSCRVVLVYATEDTHGAGTSPKSSYFHAGVGVGDCTGPVDGVGMMGYAKPTQTSNGIWQKLKAKAFVVSEVSCEPESSPLNPGTMMKRKGLTNNLSNTTIAIVIVDACMLFPDVKPAVLKLVKKEIDRKYKTQSPFIDENVCVCATHTHSGPGGYSPHGLYNATLGGAVNESFDALVDGVVEALLAAYEDCFETKNIKKKYPHPPRRCLSFAATSLVGVATNRSVKAFERNPKGEIDRLKKTGNVDETISVLVVEDIDASGESKYTSIRGAAAWFAVHGTSLPSDNRLVSGDNKGVASSLVEAAMSYRSGNETKSARDSLLQLYEVLSDSKNNDVSERGLANGDIVATAKSTAETVMASRFDDGEFNHSNQSHPIIAFPQSASGDVSPNVLGAFDEMGDSCDGSESLLLGTKVTDCRGRGPNGTENDMYLSCLVTGTAQAAAVVAALEGIIRSRDDCIPSLDLITPSSIPLTGPVKSATRWVPIGREGGVPGSTKNKNKNQNTTATPALGYSFAAGTTDGPGEDGFWQGDRLGDTDRKKPRFLSYIATLLFGKRFGVPPEVADKHFPKPVLASFGDDADESNLGWVTRDVQVQAFRIGHVLIISIPAEVTTVAGSRLREVAAETADEYYNNPSTGKQSGPKENGSFQIIINGVANGYSGYVTTEEEYLEQRYEGASCLFGPNTLSVYAQTVTELVRDLVSVDDVDESDVRTTSTGDALFFTASETSTGATAFPGAYQGPRTRPKNGVQSFIPPFDLKWPPWRAFGECLDEVEGGVEGVFEDVGVVEASSVSLVSSFKELDLSKTATVTAGDSTDSGEAAYSFLVGRPRRCPKPPPNGSYLVVERYSERDGTWFVVADDDDLSTIVEWRPVGPFGLGNLLTLRWRPPVGTKGVYRLGVAGAALGVTSWLKGSNELEFFQGVSGPFLVV